jgi:hypothetical protein
MNMSKPKFIEPTNVYFEINHNKLQFDNKNFVIFDEIFSDNKRIVILSSLELMRNLGRYELWIEHSM